MPIVLAGPEPPCPFCTRPFTLPPPLAAKVLELRQTVARRNASEEQFIGRQARLGREHGVDLLIFPGVLWLLAVFTIGSMIDTPGVDIGALMTTASEGDSGHKAWLLSALTLALGITLLGFGVALFRARGMIDEAFPMPPVAAGEAPRCRVCSAPLPGGGRVQQCRYCGADHLVLGHFQDSDQKIERALARHEKRLGSSLAERSEAVWSSLRVGAYLSVAVVLASPVVLFIGPFRPEAFYLAALSVVLGALVVTVATSRPVPKIRTLPEARYGDILAYQGVEYSFLGQLHLPTPGEQPTSYAFLLADKTGAPVWALKVPDEDDGEEHAAGRYVTLHPLSAGGAPLGDSEDVNLQPLSRDRRITEGPLHNSSPVGLWRSQGGALWLKTPQPGAAPWCTVAPPKRIPREHLAFRSVDDAD